MDDYMDKNTAINLLDNLIGMVEDTQENDYDTALKMGIEALNVQPVRHGHWETIDGWDGDELYRCSACGDEFVLIDGTPNDNNYWFCPNCGADMRGEQNV
jgi:rubrerythrin